MEYDPSSYEIQADPFPVYRWLRDEAPVYRNERHGFYALSRFEDVLGALTRPDVLSSTSGPQLEATNEGLADLQEMMIGTDPPRHTELRKLVSRAFTPRRVNELEPFVRETSRRLLDELAEQGSGDFVASFGALLPATVITTLMGLPTSYRDEVRTLTDRLLHREPGELTPPPDAAAAGLELYTMLAELVRERRTNPTDDMATALTETELDDHQIAMFYVLLAVAGYETTAKLLANLVVELEQFRDQRELVAADPSLVPATIEESLRFESPAQYQLRVAMQPVTLHGTTIDAGERVVIVAGAANRDDREFADPDAFDVRRDAARHLGFGHGIHFCLGASLARMEAVVAMEELLARHPDYEVDLDGIERRWSSNFRGLSKVPIRLS